MYSAVAENVLGTIGTVCWCIQLVPQIIRNYRKKECEGLPPMMMLLWAASGVPFSIYFIGTKGSVPLQVQPQLFTFFCVVSWLQTLYYPPMQLSKRNIIAQCVSFVVIAAALEVGLILWLRPVYSHGTHWPLLVVGIVASVLLALGLVPPYFELAKRQGRVIGINFVFLTMDSLGAFFSLLSIVFGTMDVMSLILYAIVLAMELGIFTSHFVWWLRFGRRLDIKPDAEEAMELASLTTEKLENEALKR